MQLTHEILSLRLREPFTNNKGRITSIRQIVVRVHWGQRTGVGTAVFAREYGMLPDPVQAALETCAQLLDGASPFELEPVLDRLEAAVPEQPTAVAAVDMALHDLLGQVADLPLHRLWGLGGLPLPPTGLSLGALPDAELVERARQLTQWPILKLKLTPASDPQVLGRVRDVYPGRLWIDGNGAWSAAQAIAAAEIFHCHGVELLEQPIAAGTPDVLRFVRERSPVPIVADEDCMGPRDVPRLEGCADVINVKLLKCGGLRRAIEMIHLAHQAGLRVMLGCKTESVLGVTAMAQLAGLADYVDLDGHLDVLEDPYAGIAIECGQITLPAGPGLGITPAQTPNTGTGEESCLRLR
jgi:L-alanine-DL-glutamate epimerase-like enolase superfamily enzyme